MRNRTKDLFVSPLQSREANTNQIEQLEEVIVEKEDEIMEFQAVRRTLAALATGTNAPNRKYTRKSVHSDNVPGAARQSLTTQRRSGRSIAVSKESNMIYQDVPERLGEADRSFESTSSKSGPTPKRSKPRKSFKDTAIRQPRLSFTAPKSTKAQDTRLPLRDVSAGRVNVSPVKLSQLSKGEFQQLVERKHGKGNNNDEVDDMEFGSEIVLTSTPYTPKSTKPMGNEDDHGDTTVDE
jgi:hypothetical protein